MRNEIIRELQSEYQLQEQQDGTELKIRQEEAENKNPRIRELLQQRQDLFFTSCRDAMNHRGDVTSMPEKMKSINNEITEELEKSGFPKDYLEPHYRCPICRDKGYVGENIREMCSCMKTELYRRLYQEAGLSTTNPQTFATFDLSIFPDNQLPGMNFSQRRMMELYRDICSKWADEYPHPETQDILMSGSSGLGKTFLMNCIADRLLQKGCNVLMITAYRLLEIARQSYFSSYSQSGEKKQMEDLISADVLMIDDVGSEPLMENITVAQFFNLLNERQLARRSTIISTNLNIQEFREKYTERVASRLCGNNQCLRLQFYGSDLRTLGEKRGEKK